MKEYFFRRVSIDKEARTAHIETLIGTTTWYKADTFTGIDPENFDYAAVEGVKRVLENDSGPYQYYWVAADMATWKEIVKEKLSSLHETFTRLHIFWRVIKRDTYKEQGA